MSVVTKQCECGTIVHFVITDTETDKYTIHKRCPNCRRWISITIENKKSE